MTDNPFERAKARLDGGRAWGSGEHLDDRDCIESACGVGWTAEAYEISWPDSAAIRDVLRSVVTEQYPEQVNRVSGEVITWAWNDELYRTEGPAAHPKVEAILDKCALRWEESR